jgi:hypothetical protein
MVALIETDVRSSGLLMAILLVFWCAIGSDVQSRGPVSTVDEVGGVSVCCLMGRGAPW